MKVRTGFVSNSSSSSFCVLGISVDSNEIIKMLFNGESTLLERSCSHDIDTSLAFCPVCGKPVWLEYGIGEEEIDEEWRKQHPGLGYYFNYGDEVFIGWNIVNDSYQDLLDAKESVAELEKLLDGEAHVYSGEYPC